MPPKNATDTFLNDLRSALGKAGFRVTDVGSGARDLALEACVRATSAAEKTTFWEATGRSAHDFWDAANGEFGKDPDGFLFETGTTMCPTKGRNIVIGQQKSEGYDSGAAAAAVANRLSACEPLIALAEMKAGTAPASPPPAASSTTPAATASSAPAAPPADDPGDQDVIDVSDRSRVRGEIVKEDPAKVVVIKLADGRTESIAWAAVVKITYRTEEDVVHLKDGSHARGNVPKEEPGKAVTIKRGDGRTDTFPWDEVVRVVRGRKKK